MATKKTTKKKVEEKDITPEVKALMEDYILRAWFPIEVKDIARDILLTQIKVAEITKVEEALTKRDPNALSTKNKTELNRVLTDVHDEVKRAAILAIVLGIVPSSVFGLAPAVVLRSVSRNLWGVAVDLFTVG